MTVHSIRLAGPWDLSRDAGTTWTRVKLPWSQDNATDGILLRRRFHSPTGLTNESRVIIDIRGISRPGAIMLNDQTIDQDKCTGGDSGLSIDVSQLLEPYNSLVINVSTQANATVEEVTLQIHEIGVGN